MLKGLLGKSNRSTLPNPASAARAESAGRPTFAGPRNLPHPSPTSPTRYADDLASTRAALGDAAFENAWAAGRAMTLEQAARMILTEEATDAPASIGGRASTGG
jgi:hypothetical protein